MLHTVTGAPGVVVVEGCQGHRRRWETRLLRSSVASDGDERPPTEDVAKKPTIGKKNPSVQKRRNWDRRNRKVSWRNRNLKKPREKDIFKTFQGKKTTTKMRQTGCFWHPFWLSFLKNLNKDINRPRLQYWMSWCFPSKFSIRDTESDLIFESMGRGTDGHGWAPMGRSLFFRTANSLSNAATPPFTEICTKIQTNVFKTRNTSLRKGTSWQHSTNHIYHYKNTLKDSI